MEFASLVTFSRRLLGQLLKVLSCLGHGATEKPNLDATGWAASDLNVEINLHRKSEKIF